MSKPRPARVAIFEVHWIGKITRDVGNEQVRAESRGHARQIFASVFPAREIMFVKRIRYVARAK